ncbi:MAG: alpha/beta hydrolase [Deltaproteobacteria bacterium]|nr:alpha/beta hydrolase [Deltaproteobacteria bacterium]MBW2137826.1 alpha/beta hydrolase [Deltaproteobacteria bacterium]
MAKTRILDPGLFTPEAIDPETATFNKRLEAIFATMPPPHKMTPQRLREESESGRGWMGPVKRLKEAADRTIGFSNSEVSVRVVVPEEVKAVYLHMHGGGFVLMRPYHFDPTLVDTAKKCRVAVVSVDYRLAPENPYPAAADDCETVALWLAEKAKAEFGSDRVLIGGESAGANLAVVTLLRMRDRHGFKGFRGANLVYGCFDISMTPSQRNWGDRNLVISTPMIEWFNNHYIPQVERRRDPDVSPLYADLSDLPPALFTVGTMDPLLDDSLFMHARWIAAGNQAELAIYPGGTHVFNMFPLKIAREANARMYEFISEIADQSPPDGSA